MKGDGHQDHPLIGHRVRDTASGAEGTLTAVVREALPTPYGTPRTTRLAYIRPNGGGREFTTAVGNIKSLSEDTSSPT
ncbi:hypothetical protein [Streptomyces globosus]|uniref:hypothetical protein n=1 Tax=Streptomyces globosus TaxID=68209 RepID=UPI0031CE4E12